MADIDVYLLDNLTGRLIKTADKHVFSYHLPAREALSLTMPLRTESYQFQGLHPVFQMNLPEGHLRQVIESATAKHYGSDDLSLLAILGPNQIGRLSYAIADQLPVAQTESVPDLKSILSSHDAHLFEHLLKRFATRSGVAGVQPKILLDIREQVSPLTSKMSLPLQSYIVKSWGQEYPQLACNEFVCLSLAKNTGLHLPEFYLSDNGKLLITRRFDIKINQQAASEIIGFEDFCVLQGKGTREKYDASLESCTNTIRQFISPHLQQQALYDFFKLTLINVYMRNGDAHLKNNGVLYPHLNCFKQGQLPNTICEFAPIFDLVNTTAYIPDDTMALSLTGSKRWPKRKVLTQFGKQHCLLSNKMISKAYAEVEQGIEQTIPVLRSIAEQHPDFIPIAEVIEKVLNSAVLFS